MRVINIVPQLEKSGFGIWGAAVSTANVLNKKYEVESEIWYPKQKDSGLQFLENCEIEAVPLKSTNTKELDHLLLERNLDYSDIIINTHSSWGFQTQWGFLLKKRGFRWLHHPHGTLEPWPMQQKRLKKLLYMKLFEQPKVKFSDCIRAVSSVEARNLQQYFPLSKVNVIYNGVQTRELEADKKSKDKIRFLFLSRIHKKKGVLELAKAWLSSSLSSSELHELIIVGPDDGQADELIKVVETARNITYLGALYGPEKEAILESSHVYFLPSHSEGFPTSVVEAMMYGLMPVISQGCNFPEAFKAGVAVEVAPRNESIISVLEELKNYSIPDFIAKGELAYNYVKHNFSIEKIVEAQYLLYSNMLDHEYS